MLTRIHLPNVVVVVVVVDESNRTYLHDEDTRTRERFEKCPRRGRRKGKERKGKEKGKESGKTKRRKRKQI